VNSFILPDQHSQRNFPVQFVGLWRLLLVKKNNGFHRQHHASIVESHRCLVNAHIRGWVLVQDYENVRVIRTYCPFWQRDLYELWSGIQPLVPANNYLRANLAVADSTLADKAYRLLPFFRFLERNSVQFFDLTPQSLNPLIQLFRNLLLLRVKKATAVDDGSSRAGESVDGLGYARAKCILDEVRWLCEWWSLVNPTSMSYTTYQPGRGMRTRKRAAHDCFTIGIPKARRRFRQNHAMEQQEVDAVWAYLTSEARPNRSTLLTEYPTGPRRGWSSRRTAAWKRDEHRYRERLAWFHRQQMLWALMIGSGMRRGELPLLMTNDVQFYGEDLWVTLRVRNATENLGRAKTGPRMMFIGWDLRILTAWQNWARSRQILIDKWIRETGNPPHEMFLTNRNGGPLTVDGLDSLFEALNRRFQIFGGEFVEDQFKAHPHAVRHTLKSLFEDWEVPQDVIQLHRGHRNPQTTDRYGKVYRKTYVSSLSGLKGDD
jgi:integrase